jgi:hypothetical protein
VHVSAVTWSTRGREHWTLATLTTGSREYTIFVQIRRKLLNSPISPQKRSLSPSSHWGNATGQWFGQQQATTERPTIQNGDLWSRCQSIHDLGHLEHKFPYIQYDTILMN